MTENPQLSPIAEFDGDPLTDLVDDQQTEISADSGNRLEILWEQLAHAGLVEPAIRIGTLAALIVLVLIVVWLLRLLYFSTPETSISQGDNSFLGAAIPTSTSTMASPVLPSYSSPESVSVNSVQRIVEPNTIIPSRSRVDVIPYMVKPGDTVIGIAASFGLNPETILWSNYNVLADNPHSLQPGQVLEILPVNGTYHKWSAGEDLQKVADFYNVDPMVIIEWPGNPFDIYETNLQEPGVQPGTKLIIPNGTRELIDYGPPIIPRDNPAVAHTYGPGHCGELMDGAIGGGTFIWPTASRLITGYDYSPNTNHWGLDIDGEPGDAVWSIDNGVVVYSGWSYNGYGNLVVIDHGNSWQSLYAHLSDIYVSCGESVFQATNLGAIGNTGNSGGPHLHFELIYGSAKVNPWDFLP